MGQSPIDAVLALDDRRRPQPHAAAVARRLGELGGVPVTVYEVADAASGPLDVVDLIGHRDGGVLVMDVHGGGFPGDRLFDADAEAAIASGRMPVLAIGPNASMGAGPDALIIAVDHSASPDAALAFGARWRATFSPSEVAVVMLDAPSGWCENGEVGDDHVGHGLDGLVDHVVSLDPCRSICATAAIHHNPVVVVAAPVAPGISHWFATARHLIRTAPFLVVVVPNHA